MKSRGDNNQFEGRSRSLGVDPLRSTTAALQQRRLGLFTIMVMVVAGGLLGVVLTLGVSALGRKPRAASPTVAEEKWQMEAARNTGRMPRPFVSAPVSVIEPGQAAPSGPAPGLPAEQRSPAEMRAAIHAQFDQAVQAHQAEPISAQWASATKQVLSSYIQHLPSKLGVRAVETDCRSKSCLMTLEWTNRARATATFQDVLRSPLDLECERTIVFPEGAPGPKGATFRARMLVNCPNQPS